MRPGGTLGIFANQPLRGSGLVDARIQQAYADHAPEIYSRWIGHNAREHFLGLFAGAPEFRAPQVGEYSWRAEYGSHEYLDLLRTHSDHRLLPTARLSNLLKAISGAIDQNGGRLVVDYVAVLCRALPA